MNNIAELSKCAACGCCWNICPVDAISVDTDHCFYTPTVDNEKCIQCGKCVSHCPVNESVQSNRSICAYAAWSKEKSAVLESSSGGAFHELASNVLASGGVVFSAVYSDDFKEVFFQSSDICNLIRFQKSKYVESNVLYSFRDIKKELLAGRTTLFCGTPCQNAGLKSFLEKEYANLILCDFSCGGVPSHKLYKSYLEMFENIYKSQVINVDFRPKTHGWKRYALKITFANQRKLIRLAEETLYFKAFFGKMSVRDYCLECKFSEQHVSDITLADFWLHDQLCDTYNENGTSLIICNTVKGRHFLAGASDNMFLKEINLESALYNFKPRIADDENKKLRKEFILCFESDGIIGLNKKYSNPISSRVKSYIKRIIYRKHSRRIGRNNII